MLNIRKHAENGVLTLAPEGRLDTTTAPELERMLTLDGVTTLIFDLENWTTSPRQVCACCFRRRRP